MTRDERGNAMMMEFWWKVFLAAVLTAIVAKLFGCPWSIGLLFSVAYIGWAVGLVLALVVLALGERVRGLWKKKGP
jgi:hypothetical protein